MTVAKTVRRATLVALVAAMAAPLVRADGSGYDSPTKWIHRGGAPSDPVQSITDHLGDVVEDLADGHTDKPVQAKQTAVVGEFDSLIKQLEAQCKSGGSGSNPNPTKPATKSQIRKGPGGSGPLHDPSAGQREWAKLTPKDRERITQSGADGFPPGYESVLESYYSRLAQEQVTSGDDKKAAPPAAGPAAPPTTQPGK